MANKRTFVLNNPYPITSVGPVNADLDDYVRNPMHEQGDMIVGGTAGYPERLPKDNGSPYVYLHSGDGDDPSWRQVNIYDILDGDGGNLGDTFWQMYNKLFDLVVEQQSSGWEFKRVGDDLVLKFNNDPKFTFTSNGILNEIGTTTTSTTTSTTTLV